MKFSRLTFAVSGAAALLLCALGWWYLRGNRIPVILITVDTTRADHLPMYGYDGVKTPNLSALASDSVVFDKAHAHVPLTLPSHTSILTGLYPLASGVRNNGDYYAPESLDLVSEVFKKKGYETGAFVGSFVLDSRFGLNQGFDTYDDDLADGRAKKSNFSFKDRRAGMVVERALGWLKGLGGKDGKDLPPFFMWIHVYDPHDEYAPPEPFASQYAANPYDGEIAYVDSQLGRVFKFLKDADVYDEALIVLTSDHGESFGEHGEKTHSIFIYEATQWIPLIMKFPKSLGKGTRVADRVRHVDIFPTILDEARLRRPSRVGHSPYPGASLRSLARGKGSKDLPCYLETFLPLYHFGWSPLQGIIHDGFKFIEAPRKELYDLGADPHELHNLLESQAGKAASLSRLLEKAKKEYAENEADATASRAADEETAKKLAALGYMVGGPKASSQAGKDPKDAVHLHEELQKAHAYVSANRHAEAVPLLRKLLAQDEANSVARGSLAGAYRELGLYKESLEEYIKIRDYDPTYLQAYTGPAVIYTKHLVDFAKARKELDAAAAISPKETALMVLEGDWLLNQGKNEEAFRVYKKAQDMGEQAPNLYVGMGSALNKLDRLDEAVTALGKALEMNPETYEAHYNLGVVLERKGRYDLSERAYRASLRYKANDVLTLGNLGSLYQKQGRYLEAAKILQEGVRINPRDRICLYNLATVYMAQQKIQEAVALYEKTLKIYPDFPEVLNNVSIAYQRLKNHEKALEKALILGKVESAPAPLRAMAYYRAARLKLMGGNKAAAQDLLAKAKALDPKGIQQAMSRDPLFGGRGRSAVTPPKKS